MKSAIGTGKSVEKAIEDALQQLGCSQDEVTVKVISEGGLFKKAEVELTRDNYVEEAVEQPQHQKKEEQQPKTEQKLTVHLEETHQEKPAAKKPQQKQETKKATSGKNKEILQSFLENLLSLSSARNAKAHVSEEDAHYKATISGEALSGLIGSGGETLQAIETVLNVISAKNRNENKRVMLDVGEYKQAKITKLHELADNTAKKVRETGEQIKLKPMTNHERRIVHAYLQNQKDIKTYSKGEEPHRCVVLTLAEKTAEATPKEIKE